MIKNIIKILKDTIKDINDLKVNPKNKFLVQVLIVKMERCVNNYISKFYIYKKDLEDSKKATALAPLPIPAPVPVPAPSKPPQQTERVSNILNKIRNYNDFCEQLSGAYDTKHKEVEKLVGFIDYILKNMPELPTGHKIVTEIIHTLEDLNNFEADLDLPSKLEEQRVLLQRAINNREVIEGLIRKYTEHYEEQFVLDPELEEMGRKARKNAKDKEEREADRIRNGLPKEDVKPDFNLDLNLKNIPSTEIGAIYTLSDNFKIRKENIEDVTIQYPNFVFNYCRAEKIKTNSEQEALKCALSFFNQLYINIIDFFKIVLGDKELLGPNGTKVFSLLYNYFKNTATKKGERADYYLKNYLGYIEKIILTKKKLPLQPDGTSIRPKILFIKILLENLRNNTTPKHKNFQHLLNKELGIDFRFKSSNIQAPEWLKY